MPCKICRLPNVVDDIDIDADADANVHADADADVEADADADADANVDVKADANANANAKIDAEAADVTGANAYILGLEIGSRMLDTADVRCVQNGDHFKQEQFQACLHPQIKEKVECGGAEDYAQMVCLVRVKSRKAKRKLEMGLLKPAIYGYSSTKELHHVPKERSSVKEVDALPLVSHSGHSFQFVPPFCALNCVKLQRGPFEHPSASRITIRFALELAGKSYDLPASSNVNRITKRLANGCSKGPRCVFSALNCVKLQHGPSEHPSASCIIIRIILELADKPYDLSASSNASRITKRLADVCSEDPCCVFSALNCVKLQRGPSVHPSTSRITIQLILKLDNKPYDLPTSSNASRLIIRLADGCSKGPRCVFSALNCVKLQRGPFEHHSTNRITIRFVLELVRKPYDLPAISNASRITKRLADGCSEDPRCVFNALNYVKLQRGPFEHPSASRITIQLALELADKSYDLSSSSNASRIVIRLADGCSKDPRCVFNALDCVKLQRGPSEHPSASRITIRLALKLVGKPYDLPTNSNANRFTMRLTNGYSKDPRCIFNALDALDCVKLQRGPSQHPSARRITIQFALDLADNPYDLPASSNANRLTIRLADGCSKGPRCVFNALDCVKLQRGSFEHLSASRITIRLALELGGKPYDLPASSNTRCITKRLADVCSEGPRCVFSALDYVKLQRGPFEHPSASCITIRLALEFVSKLYDLAVNSNTNRLIIRLSLELVGKPYDLPTSSNANRITKRIANGCSEGSRCVFSALNCVKLQRGHSEHPSIICITIRFALELAGKPYDLPASSNASRLTIQLADGCSEGPRYVFSALNCVKLQRGLSEHPSASRITIRFALELAGKPYDLSASLNAKRITKRLVDGCSKGPRCVFSVLNCIKLQRGPFEHPLSSRITIRFALELASKPYDLPASSNVSRLTIRLVDVCSECPRCVFSALYYL
ncbi:hypothetical protein L7F22_048071 [Adiantum nelumboides]|nr:hypothetical protein [Adiantum nelumboides]